MAHLNHAAAKFELYELEERERHLRPVDCRDRGNIATRLVQCASEAASRERFAASIARILQAAGPAANQIEIAVLSPAELAFRVHGLEFARARVPLDPASFARSEELVFGLGCAEHLLDAASEPAFQELLQRVLVGRHAATDRNSVLWRMHPERWLESLVKNNVEAVDSSLCGRDVPLSRDRLSLSLPRAPQQIMVGDGPGGSCAVTDNQYQLHCPTSRI